MDRAVAQRPILVVEDDLDLRDILTEFLRGEGHQVSTAANGAEALEVLEKDPASSWFIVLDLMMPVMDGQSLLQALGAHGGRHKVVVVSANSHLRAELSSHPLVGSLPKPFEIAALRQLIARHL